MHLLDDQGRVFGIVNVIDLLAVLFALAVVVAGVALVFSGGSGGDPDLGTRYVTVDLGTQPDYVTERIDAGDAAAYETGNLTVTDVYATPAGGGGATVTIRARVVGQRAAESPDSAPLSVAGDALLLGRELPVETDEYRVSGTVTAVERGDDTLAVSPTPILLTTTMPATRASAIDRGDTYATNGRALATVESVTAYPVGNGSTRRVLLGLSLETISRSGGRHFGGQPVALGRSLSIPFDDYDVRGEVTRLGRSTPPGEVSTTTVVLRLSNVAPERATNVHAGLTERVGDTRYAVVTDVRIAPSEVVLTSQDGNISLHDHPRNLDVTLTVDLRTRETGTGLTFHGEPLRLDERILLVFDALSVRGTPIEIRG
ncbi:DUF4330 family protein [Haloplanus halophilus]|uniref:DUF4330 family protein n=1 Tax=Haloplanus halophilus TaxID=2949993 RepID=UPI00203D297D|nr:DUF4330 family protein [Haloplanus sp. GDY1]